MSSIKDVAVLAGVSVMTVSRVINNNYPVSDSTRVNVLKAIKELDYEPNLVGRSLRSSNAKSVLVAGLGFVEPMLDGIYKAAGNLGYEVFLMHTRDFDKNDFLRRLKNGLASSILFMNMPDEEIISEISTRYKVVQCGSAARITNGCTVAIDEEAAAYQLTSELIRQGRNRIALISSDYAGYPMVMSESRKKGVLRALAANGLTADPGLFIRSPFLRDNLKPALQTAESLARMDKAKRPDAVICEQNILAMACVNTFRDLEIAVPGEIAVASLDDQPVNEICKPSITAVSRPYEAMGSAAMHLLAALNENKMTANRQIVFNHELVRRDSI